MCSCWCIKFYSVNVQEMLIPQSVTDTESTTLDIGGFSDTSQSLPGLGDAGKKVCIVWFIIKFHLYYHFFRCLPFLDQTQEREEETQA